MTMIRIAVSLLVFVSALACFPTTLPRVQRVSGSGRSATLSYNLADFDAVHVSSAFRATITQGEAFSVAVIVDENVAPYVEVVQQGSELRVGFRSNVTFSNVGPMQIEITMPRLTELVLSGASRARVSGFESEAPVALKLSGASELEGDLAAGPADVQLSGSSRLTLTGRATSLKLEASGASRAEMSGFPVGDADISASGASTVVLYVSGNLSAEASGASRVHYLGEPRLGSIRTSGASEIAPK